MNDNENKFSGFGEEPESSQGSPAQEPETPYFSFSFPLDLH